MIIPYLEELLKYVSGEAVASAVGLELKTLESLTLGMYRPTSALLQEFKSLYGMFNYERLKSYGLPPEEASKNRYKIDITKIDSYNELLQVISKISQIEEVDPNIILENIKRSEKEWEEIKEGYSEISLDMDYFNTVKNELLYL